MQDVQVQVDSAVPLLLFGVVALLALASLVFWLWSLVDCITKEPSSTEKVIWIVLIVFLGIIGSILYVLIRRGERIRQTGQ